MRRLTLGPLFRPVLVFAFMGASIFSCLLAHAQVVSPSQLTPSDLRPRDAAAPVFTLPAASGLTPPADVASATVMLGGFQIEGDFAEIPAQTQTLDALVRGRALTIEEIYRIASGLEIAYSDLGYAFVRVVVPPQSVKGGLNFRLIVVDGYLEDLEIHGVPQRLEALVRSRLQGLIGRRHLRRDELERKLLLVMDTPGLRLRSTQVPGRNGDGGTKLVLEGTYELLTTTAGGDNRAPASMHGVTYNYSVALNSIASMGERLYVSAASGYDLTKVPRGHSPIVMLGGGVALPIGDDGLNFNPEYTHSVTQPQPALGSPATIGVLDRLDVRLVYPLLTSRSHTLKTQVSFQWLAQTLNAYTFATELYRDQYTQIRAQLEDQLVLGSGASLTSTAFFAQGLGGRHPDATEPIGLSRAGASPIFDRFNLSMHLNQPLQEDRFLDLIARAQSSFGQPLLVAEGFNLDGTDALSGFDAGLLTVDAGITLRAELGQTFHTAPGHASVTLSPYVFGAAGRGSTYNAIPTQNAIVNAASFGMGLRAASDLPGLHFGQTITMELARDLSDGPVRQNYRGMVSASIRF